MQTTNSATYCIEFEPEISHGKTDSSVRIKVEAVNLSTEQHNAIREALNEFSTKTRRVIQGDDDNVT